jgi:hypothetical protein
VQSALGSARAEPAGWRVEALRYQVVWWGSNVYRVAGTTTDGQAWNLVLKALRRPPAEGRVVEDGLWNAGVDPRGYSYWRREADLYRDGLLDRAWGGFAPPRCYGVDEPDPDNVRLWLEDVAETVGRDWPLERHALAARHLGQFNGASLVGEPMPAHPSFGSGYRRPDPDAARWRLDDLDSDRWQQPTLRAIFPPAVVERMRAIWRRYEMLVRAVEQAPRLFVHRDAFRNNLIARGDQTVALDWALAGPGHLGEDLYKMVINDLGFLRARYGAKEFEAVLFDGYVAGLHDAGWRGDARVARLGYAATALHHVPYGHLLRPLSSPEQMAEAVRSYGHPAEELVASMGDLAYMLIGLAEEALELAG